MQKFGSLGRSPGTRWIGMCILLAVTMGSTGQTQEIEEYQLKAAFLFNFTKFINWPHADASTKLTACIVNSKEVAAALQTLIDGKTGETRHVIVQRLSFPADWQSCQVLFIGNNGKKSDEILAATKNLPIVTVGEDEKFLRRGGIINFVLEEGKLRFEINTDAAGRAGVNISSKLLGLAKIVRDKS